MTTDLEDSLRAAGKALDGMEIVPGLPVSAPEFGPRWTLMEVDALRELVGRVPDRYAALLVQLGGISAIEAGGGFASMSLSQTRQELSQDYAAALRRLVDDNLAIDVLPFGTNSSGSYFLLACDDSGVWKFNVHMRPVATPVRVADSTAEFFMRVVQDWRLMAAGGGGPYVTE